MKTAKSRRWIRALKGLGLTVLVLVALNTIIGMVNGVPPSAFLYAAAYNGYQDARVRVSDALARPKDPGPVPDARVVAAANGFGLRLFTRMAAGREGQNVFFSPSSVATGLTMAYNGAAGPTKAAMAKALGLDGIPLDDVNIAYERIQAHLAATHPRIQVANAHGLWVDDQARLVPDFGRRMEDSFGARAEALDLQSPGALDRINGWVREKTDGRIDGVLDRLDPYDRLVLADALTFHGTWTHQFDRRATRPAPFYRLDGSEKTVPMMFRKATVGFFDAPDGTFAAGRLPYGDGSMAMYVFVPVEGVSLPAFLKSLTPERWDGWMGQFREHEIPISLPRFRADFRGDLSDPLIAAGLKTAFDDDADFSAMAEAEAGLFINRVLHRARLEVDEKGTRAEAITVVIAETGGIETGIRADRPFFCAIRDERTGLILFAGAIYDPEALATD